MKTQLTLKYLLSIFIMSLLAACTGLTPAGADTGPTSIQLNSPENNLIVSTGSLVQLRSQAYIPLRMGGIERVEFFANGRSIGTGEAVAATTADSTGSWRPAIAGEYFLQAIASNSVGRRIISRRVRVCVIDLAGLPPEGATIPDSSSCQPPPISRISLPKLPEPPTLDAFGPEELLGSLGCSRYFGSGLGGMMHLDALVHDPSLVVDFGLFSLPGIGRVLVYSGAGPVRWYGAVFFVPDGFAGSYTFEAFSAGHVVLSRTLPIPTEDCDAPLATPTPTLIPVPTDTPTLVPYEPKPTKGKGGGVNCGDYQDQGKCKAAGCTWDDKSASCG